MTTVRASFGTLLKHYREVAALSQWALADQAGLSLDAISALESGRRGGPRLETARRLSDALGLSGEDRAIFLASARPSDSVGSVSSAPEPVSRHARDARPPTVAYAPQRMAGSPALPRPTGHLIGRERAIAMLVHLVQQTALLTLVGPGGVGKTRLALHVAAEVQDQYADGVVFVPLAAISDPALVGTAIATALDVQESRTRSLTASLIAALRSRHILLVLDNFEQVIEAARLIADLLASCASLSVLVTSRVPLHLSGEQEFPVLPLALPTLAETMAGQVDTLRQVAAVALFIARAQRVGPDFALTPENVAPVVAICRRLDGLPLAIELAAARIKILSPEALRIRLEQNPDLLSEGARDLPARQQTLRNTIAWSYGLLSAEEQVLFARLGGFVGGFALRAVTAICGHETDDRILDGLATLVDQSLLQRDAVSEKNADDPRFMMLETVREFARDQLATRGEADEQSRQHARYFTALAEEAITHIGKAEHAEWAEQLERDAENVWAALTWSVARAEAGEGEATELGLRLAAKLGEHWLFSGRAREAQRALQRLLDRKEGAYPRARAGALFHAGYLAGFAGELRQADALFAEALMLGRATGDSGIICNALINLGMRRTDPAQRQADIEEAVTLCPDARVCLAAHYLGIGDFARARFLAEDARVAAIKAGQQPSNSLDVLAHIARAEEDTETARRLFEEALAIRRIMHTQHPHMIGHIARFLGEIAEEQGEIEQARAYYREALYVHRDGWDVNRTAAILRGVAVLALGAGNPERALCLAGAVQAVQTIVGSQIFVEIAPELRLWGRTSWEQIQEAARQALSPEAAAAAWAAGQATSLDAAIVEALDELS